MDAGMSTVAPVAPDSPALYFDREEVARCLRAGVTALAGEEERETYTAICEAVIEDQVKAHRARRSEWLGDLQREGITPDQFRRAVRRILVAGIPATHEEGEYPADVRDASGRYPSRCDPPCPECRDLRAMRSAVWSAIVAAGTGSPARHAPGARVARVCARPTCDVIIPASKPTARYCSAACRQAGYRATLRARS
jgi:hypothetical protein